MFLEAIKIQIHGGKKGAAERHPEKGPQEGNWVQLRSIMKVMQKGISNLYTESSRKSVYEYWKKSKVRNHR